MKKTGKKNGKEVEEMTDMMKEIMEMNSYFKEELATSLEKSTSSDIKRLSFGSLGYDIVTGGGVPLGRNVLLHGAESSGKTTIAIMSLVAYQKSGDSRYALVLDSEYAFDKKYAKKLGVDLSRVIFTQPDNSEQTYKVLKYWLEKNKIGWFLLDSIASTLPQSIIDSDLDASNMGVHAKEMGKIFKSLNPMISKNEVVPLWINQERDSLGGYGGGIAIPGGKAQKFYAGIVIQVFRGTKTDNKDGTYKNEGWIRVTKNKTAPPYQEAKYDMTHGKGICVSSEILTYGVACNMLYKKGHSFYYDQTLENNEEDRKNHICLGKSKAEAVQFLNDNIEFKEALYADILATYLQDEDLEMTIEELEGVPDIVIEKTDGDEEDWNEEN